MEKRLIDANTLMEQPVWLCGGWIGDSYAEGYMDALDKVEETVKSSPTIDAVPVEMIAKVFGNPPCQYTFDSSEVQGDDFMGEFCMDWCESNCDKVPAVECWKKFFEAWEERKDNGRLH